MATIRDIGSDALSNIAEYTTIGRLNDINALGISDEYLVDRIKMYDKNFSYSSWKKDLKKKKELQYLVGSQYIPVAENDDEFRFAYVIKPDENARVLSSPDSLEEYLTRAIALNRSYYRKYTEHLTGDWIMEVDWNTGSPFIITTDDPRGMFDAIENQYDVDEDGNKYYTSTKRIRNGKVIVETTENSTSDSLFPIILGMLDVIDLQYPIQFVERDRLNLVELKNCEDNA